MRALTTSITCELGRIPSDPGPWRPPGFAGRPPQIQILASGPEVPEDAASLYKWLYLLIKHINRCTLLYSGSVGACAGRNNNSNLVRKTVASKYYQILPITNNSTNIVPLKFGKQLVHEEDAELLLAERGCSPA